MQKIELRIPVKKHNMMKTKDEMRIYQRNWARNKRGTTEETIKNSCTYKGRKSELLALKILKGGRVVNFIKEN